jgi:hypothetical protein
VGFWYLGEASDLLRGQFHLKKSLMNFRFQNAACCGKREMKQNVLETLSQESNIIHDFNKSIIKECFLKHSPQREFLYYRNGVLFIICTLTISAL